MVLICRSIKFHKNKSWTPVKFKIPQIPFAFEFECNRPNGNLANVYHRLAIRLISSYQIAIRPITLQLKCEQNLRYSECTDTSHTGKRYFSSNVSGHQEILGNNKLLTWVVIATGVLLTTVVLVRAVGTVDVLVAFPWRRDAGTVRALVLLLTARPVSCKQNVSVQ